MSLMALDLFDVTGNLKDLQTYLPLVSAVVEGFRQRFPLRDQHGKVRLFDFFKHINLTRTFRLACKMMASYIPIMPPFHIIGRLLAGTSAGNVGVFEHFWCPGQQCERCWQRTVT
jgi:hypothetical protein